MRGMLRISIAIGLFGLFAGCDEAQAPKRPVGIAENAVWQGAEDGGFWVSCDFKNENVIRCTTYLNGLKRYSTQEFIICSSNNASNLMWSPDGEGLRDVPVGEGTFFLRPIAASQEYSAGVLNEELSMKGAEEFSEMPRTACESRYLLLDE